MAASDTGVAGDGLRIPVARARVPAGQRTRTPVVIGPRGLRELLPDVVRRVADLPPGTTPVVVWHQSQVELALVADLWKPPAPGALADFVRDRWYAAARFLLVSPRPAYTP